MEISEITYEKPLSFGTEDLKSGWNTSENKGISSLSTGKVDSLKASIQDLNKLIDEREILSKKVFREGEKLKTQINNFLIENDSKHSDDPMDSRNIMSEKNQLRDKLIAVSEMQLNEKVGCWKDIALLKRELREMERDLSEKESRSDMLNKILEDEE